MFKKALSISFLAVAFCLCFAGTGSWTKYGNLYKPDIGEKGVGAKALFDQGFDTVDRTLNSFSTTDGINKGLNHLFFTNGRARTAISSAITGLAYDSGSGVFSLGAGYALPTTTQTGNWDTAFGWGNYASAGYVPGTKTINGHALSSDISINATDVGLGYIVASDYGSPSRATLVAADAVAAAAGKQLVITPGNWTIDADTTLSAKVKVMPGATLAVATTKTLTISGAFEAGIYQIFSCSRTGKVVFGKSLTVYPIWWGAAGDGVTNDYAPIQAALNSLSVGGTIKLTAASYLSSGSTISWPAVSNIVLEGDSGNRRPRLIIKHTENYGISIGLTDGLSGVTIRNLVIQGADDFSNLPQDLIISYGSGTISNLTFQNLELKYSKLGGIRLANSAAITNDVLIDRCYFHNINWSTYNTAAGGVVHVYDGKNITISNCIWENVNTDTANTLSHAIYWEKADQDHIINNNFTGQNARCQIYNTAYDVKSDLVIDGNTFIGVKSIPFCNMTRGIVSNNVFYGCSLYITSNPSLLFTNNIFDGVFPGQNLISIQYSGGASFLKNKFVNMTAYIYISASGAAEFIGNSMAATSGKVIVINSNAGAATKIIGNYMESADSSPIQINVSAVSLLIDGNMLSSTSGNYPIVNYGANPSTFNVRNNIQVGSGYENPSGVTNLPYYSSTTLSSGTKAISLPGALSSSGYRVIVTGGANETFYITNKTASGFTINSSNGSSMATVEFIVN